MAEWTGLCGREKNYRYMKEILPYQEMVLYPLCMPCAGAGTNQPPFLHSFTKPLVMPIARTAALRRHLPFAASQEFLSSSPDRSLPLLVQFGHLSVPEARKLSFDRGCQFSWLAGS